MGSLKIFAVGGNLFLLLNYPFDATALLNWEYIDEALFVRNDLVQ